jgi:hypothetical protein
MLSGVRAIPQPVRCRNPSGPVRQLLHIRNGYARGAEHFVTCSGSQVGQGSLGDHSMRCDTYFMWSRWRRPGGQRARLTAGRRSSGRLVPAASGRARPRPQTYRPPGVGPFGGPTSAAFLSPCGVSGERSARCRFRCSWWSLRRARIVRRSSPTPPPPGGPRG